MSYKQKHSVQKFKQCAGNIGIVVMICDNLTMWFHTFSQGCTTAVSPIPRSGEQPSWLWSLLHHAGERGRSWWCATAVTWERSSAAERLAKWLHKGETKAMMARGRVVVICVLGGIFVVYMHCTWNCCVVFIGSFIVTSLLQYISKTWSQTLSI